MHHFKYGISLDLRDVRGRKRYSQSGLLRFEDRRSNRHPRILMTRILVARAKAGPDSSCGHDSEFATCKAISLLPLWLWGCPHAAGSRHQVAGVEGDQFLRKPFGGEISAGADGRGFAHRQAPLWVGDKLIEAGGNGGNIAWGVQ